MSKPAKERRKQPRAKGIAGLMVGMEPNAPGAQVRDISLSGLSFRVKSPIEFMTKLLITLVFPADLAALSAVTSRDGIACEGAVVRCDPVQDNSKDRYEIAVFFTDLDTNARKAIQKYVDLHS